MRFLIPQFDLGFLYQYGPIALIAFFVLMVLRVMSRAQKEHYQQMGEIVLHDEDTQRSAE